MSSLFTEEQLRLAIGNAVINNSHLTDIQLIEDLFGSERSNLPSVLKEFIRKEFIRQSKSLCRFAAKNWIVNSLKTGSSDFIKQFLIAQEADKLIQQFPTDIQARFIILEKEKALGNLLIECSRLFDRLREKFVPARSEDRFRDYLARWLQSGYMSLSIRRTFEQWKKSDPNLKSLKNIKWPAGSENDANWREFQKLLKNIKTDNFVETEKFKIIVNLLLATPKLTANKQTIELVGRAIFLSEWLTRIQDSMTKNNTNQVEIYAEDSIGIDCDLTDEIWHGKNLVMISKVVYVWCNCKIRLSGKGFVSSKTKATSASSTAYRGADGNNGKPGESSGNISILANKMFNPGRLTVELNGGRGEDGQDGGDGCDGQNGIGVTESDLNNLVVSYYSLYRDSWSTFENYSPPSNWKQQTAKSSTGNYIHRTYQDQNGRHLTYSFAADKGWIYTTYELYVLVRGSNGTSGTSGGSNGVGGQGGYNGTSTIQNPETGEQFQVNIVRNGKNSGPSGDNGAIGKSGKHGINGNDLALIDRSAKEASKHYEGSTDKKLSWSYVYEAEQKSRLDGYRRYNSKENACFIKFGIGNKIDTSERRANKAQERTTRTAASEAVAKQSIVTSKVLAKSEAIFGKEDAVLASACKATATTALNQEDVDEEEEATENVTEEVVILRQKDDVNKLAKYTPDSEKKERPTHTPESYVNHLKLVTRKTTINTNAQILFDLFTIEFQPQLLDSISLHTIFHQTKYRQTMKYSLALVLVAALQAKIVNGKSYNEIKLFNDQLLVRRRRKFKTNRLRQQLENLSLEVDTADVNPPIQVVLGADKQFGVKETELSSKLASYKDETKVKELVKSFFSQYVFNVVNRNLLMAFAEFLKNIKPYYHQQLALFAQDENFKWTDSNSVQTYLQSLKAWLVEEGLAAGKSKKVDEQTKDAAAGMEGNAVLPKIRIRNKTKLEESFENLLKVVVSDLTHWNQILKPINELINRYAQYKARFGTPPSFEKGGKLDSAKAMINVGLSSDEKSIEQTQFVIKIYFLAKSVLNYNQRLYILNATMLKEQGQFQDQIRCFDLNDPVQFLSQSSKSPAPSEGDQCEVYMTKHGLSCAPFRYLVSLSLNVKLCSYKNVSFQTVEKVETLNPTANECEIIWLHDDKPPVGIAPDQDFRKLVAAQKMVMTKYNDALLNEIEACQNLDYTQKDNLLAFASYFPQPLQNAVIEWLENYMAISQDQLLIRLLHNRLWVDGCHFSVFELQFVLISCARLKTLYHCNLNYLLLLISSVPQLQFVDVFLYLRIEYHYQKRFNPGSRILTGIQLIPNTRYKTLLAVKISDYGLPVDENDLYKVILMLQHASNGAEQLIKIGLQEWISIAQKQKWSEIGYLLKQYGSIGYYLGVLDNKGFKDEERRMREVISEATLIPEKIIALYTQWIITGEVIGDDKFFRELKTYLVKANQYPELQDRITKHQLLTTEVEQARLINWMATGKISETHVNYKNFASADDRHVDQLCEKITGLHDAPEYANERRERIRSIGRLLKSNDSKNSQNIYWLNKFDEALFKIKKKHLRDTQKVAVLCAVESKQHILEQVNTGEGKSLIIAAIATIHRKTGKRYIDVITSSPVLAQRDADEMATLYVELGLSVANNCSEDLEERKRAYTADIVYGDIARFQRDYLLHTFYKKPIKGDRTQVAVIVDEVDNMLLDNGNNMLYLSHSVPGMDLLDSLLIFIQQRILSPMYSGNKNDLEDMRKQFENATIKQQVLTDIFGRFSLEDLTKLAGANYTPAQIQAILDKLIQGNIIDADGYLKVYRHDHESLVGEALSHVDGVLIIRIQACINVILSRERSIELPAYLRNFVKLHLDELIENCKHAMFLEPNTGYVVDIDHTGKLTTALEPVITIIDSNTGADLPTSQWSGGLHQFLQLKHGCRISPMSLKAVFVSNVAYLKGYQFINGLSGTLGSSEESKTLIELYNADLIKIPTSKPKIFYEHVPFITTVEQEWIQNIYNEICDQVRGTRSVLLICEDIKQLESVLDGLIKCFGNDKNKNNYINECFKSVTVYKREHDEFNFEEKNALQPYRLIIATNLAGRGTDIKLTQSLIDAGGLHVITAFMPKNCRIEEQAFGRAARCGQPGSAQIIAFAEKAENTIEPSVFQLKMFRDNAEVHRLQSLKSFYDYHTEIEEVCLEKFRSYCDRALSAIYSTTSTNSEETLPTPSQVVYFALLDKWALWLDAKSPLINQCAKDLNQHVKETLIHSVDEFLKNHSFGDASNCFEVAKTWIDAPQSLLTIGIIQMHHKNGFQDAEDTFNKVIAEGHEFAAEAHYYKACMRMKNFAGTRQQVKSLTIRTSNEFPTNIDGAIENFYKARSLFLRRLQRKQREASIVMQLVEKMSEKLSKTSGFSSQLASIATYTQLILTNIDFLLGAPCKPEMFVQDGITESYSKEIYDAFYRQGLISPTLIARGKIEPWQIEPLRQKYKLNRAQIQLLIDSMSNDIAACAFDDHIVLDRSLIFEKCQLSSRGEFWAEMEQQKVLIETEFYIVVQDKSSISEYALQKFDQIKPFTYDDHSEISRILVRYSAGSDIGLMYKLADMNKLTANDTKLSKEIDDLLENGSLKLDKMGIAVIVPKEMSYFSCFDGVTTDDLKEFFHLTNHGAGWIVNTLQERGIFQQQSVQMTRFTLNEDIWNKLVRIHLDPEAKKPEKAATEVELLFEHAADLQKIKDNVKILNVTEEVINVYCRISTGDDKDTKLKQFFNYLIKQNILEPYIYNIWRINSKLDCSSLPQCIADSIDDFLSDRFAYTFALENLCHSLERTNSDPEPTINQIFLPENPFATVFEDLVDCGLAMPPRILSSLDEISNFDYEDFKHENTIKSVAHTNRLKLFDQTDYHMDMIPFSTYVLDQGFTIDSDLRNIINNGLKVVMTQKKAKAGWWLLNTVVSAAAWCYSKIKAAVKAIGSFCYSVVKFCLHLPGKIFSAVSNFVAPYVKEVGKFIAAIAKPLMETKFGRAVTKVANVAASAITEVSYKSLEAAEWVIEKGSKVVNYVSKKATQGVKWLADTAVVKGAVQLAKDAGAWIASTEVWKTAAAAATYIFTKMSNFCTAISESYQYYNQCRTASRRLALERIDLVDEHVILNTFRGISQRETKKNQDEQIADNMLRKSVESWRVPLVSSLESTFTKKLQALPNNKYSVDFLTSNLRTSVTLKNLEIEINDLLNVFAWKIQISYFKQIHNAFQKNIPFNDVKYQPAEQLPKDLQFFVEDAFDEVIEEFQKRNDDRGYESDTNDTHHIVDLILSESIKYKSWKDAFKAVLDKIIQNAVDSVFVERTISVILDYIASVKDENFPPSEAEVQFKNEDRSLKEALTEYNSNNQSKRKTQFLTTELYVIIQQVINSDQLNTSIIKTAIKYGYPLPLSATRTVAAAIDRYLTKNEFYKSGVLLEITDDNNKVLIQYSTKEAGAKIRMRQLNGTVFFCQADYNSYVGMSDQIVEEVKNVFFYEALVGYLKKLRQLLPRQAETLREGILLEL